MPRNNQEDFYFLRLYCIYHLYDIYCHYMEVFKMATKALNLKMDEADLLEMKQVAGVFNMTVTDLVKSAVREYLAELKNDPFYRLTACVQEASAEESAEILSEIDKLTEDDLSISSVKRFTL